MGWSVEDRVRAALVLAVLCVAVAGCGGGGGGRDASTGSRPDAATTIDAAAGDAGNRGDASVTDAGSSGTDAATADAAATDAAVTGVDAQPSPDATTSLESHVHIYIDNFCNTSVDPPSFTVPAGSTLTLSYHNHSVDYEADVWLSYGGGYLQLAKGDTWNDPFVHCAGPSPYTAYADISIAGGGGSACPGVRMYIYCQ